MTGRKWDPNRLSGCHPGAPVLLSVAKTRVALHLCASWQRWGELHVEVCSFLPVVFLPFQKLLVEGCLSIFLPVFFCFKGMDPQSL